MQSSIDLTCSACRLQISVEYARPAFMRLYESTRCEGKMRFIQSVLLLAFLGILGLFAVQNTEAITVNFWKWQTTGPVALLAIAAYFLGMLSGWTVVSFFTRSLRRVSERPAN
jgi:uncharacterized integral membrane protein